MSTLSRGPRLGITFAALISSLTMLSCAAEPEGEPLNVVLISIDSLRADHVHSYGYDRQTTPRLDRLAREGVLFETVVAESSWTLPTHVTMLSGLSSAVHGVERNEGPPLGAGVPTLAGILRDEGYRTAGFYSGPNLHPVYGFGQGFDTYEGALGYDDEDVGLTSHPGPIEAGKIHAASRRSHRTVTSPLVTRRAIDFISEQGDRPFFLFFHYFDVHYDYIPPESYWRTFDPDYRGSLSADNYARNAGIHAEMDSRELEHVIALYDGEILFTDEHVGQVIDALDRNGLAASTLVAVTSDHGQEFFEHGRKGHAKTLFDEVLLVPLIMRCPGRIPAEKRIEVQVRHLDVMPTLLGYAGVAENLDGTDLSGLAEGRVDLAPLDAMSRLRRKGLHVSLRTPRYKYISVRKGRRQTESLYDLEKDPGEHRTLFWREQGGSPGARESFERLKDRLAQEERQMGAARGDREAVPLDLPEDLEESLRALGYLDEEGSPSPRPTAP